MRRAITLVALLAAACVLVSASDAGAQRRRRGGQAEQVDPLTAAEQAYTEVDFERTLEHAGTALQAGGHAPARLVRIYQLLGVSAAALGDPDGARDFFQRMLAIDPSAQLDDTVPPRLRAPYLEARGIVSARPEQLGVEVGIDRPNSAVRVELTDPFQMARTVRVHARLEGAVEFTSTDSEAMAEVIAPLPGADAADRIEYWVELIDPYGNQLVAVGSEFEPRTVGRVAVVAATPPAGAGAGGTTAPAEGGGGSILEDPLFWIITGGAILVAGGVVTGILVDQASRVPVQTGVTIGALATW